MVICIEIPRFYIGLVDTELSAVSRPRNVLITPIRRWLEERDITGYFIHLHDYTWYIDFANVNDAIRFKLNMVNWGKTPIESDAGMYFCPYEPLR